MKCWMLVLQLCLHPHLPPAPPSPLSRCMCCLCGPRVLWRCYVGGMQVSSCGMWPLDVRTEASLLPPFLRLLIPALVCRVRGGCKRFNADQQSNCCGGQEDPNFRSVCVCVCFNSKCVKYFSALVFFFWTDVIAHHKYLVLTSVPVCGAYE